MLYSITVSRLRYNKYQTINRDCLDKKILSESVPSIKDKQKQTKKV